MKFGIVVQRYGDHFAGGAEFLAGIYARYLKQCHDNNSVTVLTTCAKDYQTWANDYPSGETTEAGIIVKRFPVVEVRNFAAFSQFSYAREINAFAISREDEVAYFKEQGPFAPELVDFLEASYDNFDVFIFFTYLYYPTVMGLPRVADKAYLVSTAHDEPPLYFLRTYAPLFHSLKGIIYLSEDEREIINRTYKIPSRVRELPGLFGIEPPKPLSEACKSEFTQKYRHLLDREYFLYVGRASQTKNCLAMIHAFDQAKHRTQTQVNLVFCGFMDLELPARDDILDLGFVSEDEKGFLISHAIALINPSAYESLSIVLLEAWNHATPVVVNGASKTMKDLCKRSNGGLYFESEAVFTGVLVWCLNYKEELHTLGVQGQQFVRHNYNWHNAYTETFRHLR